MSYVHPIPPLRELPQGRLAQRSQHLRSELDRAPERTHRRRKALVLVAAAVVLAATLLATPALGLRDQLAHLFGSDKRPPDVIVRYFTNQDPQGVQGLLPAKALLVSALAIPGYGHMTIWAAPTKDGGFCSTSSGGAVCNPHRKVPFAPTLIVTGPTSRDASYDDPRNVHVIIRGQTLVRGAANLAAHYEDGSIDRTPIAWVGKPIEAGFFIYEIRKDHWEPGKRLAALTVEDADGRVLARDTQMAGYFRETQTRSHLALPAGVKPPAPPPPPQPTYSKTFSDPEGDAGSSLDITEVKVTEWTDSIEIDLTAKGNPGLFADGPLVALDLDQNPDTGSAFYGTEVEVALLGGDTEGGGVLYKAHGWDFLAQVQKLGQEGLGLMTGSDKVGFVIPRSLLGPDPEPGFNIVATSLGSHSDTAPDIGTFDVEPGGSTHPPLGPDRRPPKLLAFDSLGTRGKDAKLEYWVLEGRGRTRQVIRIVRGHRLLKTIWTPLADANPFGTAETTWHVPPKLRGRLRFSVRSIDAAGNKSALAQAALVVR
jgi:hypothetical protein